jgi:hypothetical protein
VAGASFDPDTPEVPNDVHVSVGGTWGEAAAIGFDVPADRSTNDAAFCSYGGASGGPGTGGAALAAVIGLISAWIRRWLHRSVTSGAGVR